MSNLRLKGTQTIHGSCVIDAKQFLAIVEELRAVKTVASPDKRITNKIVVEKD